jgi:hypothetical protein
MTGFESTPMAALRHRSQLSRIFGPLNQHNRGTTGCYGNSAITSILDASGPFGVMALRLAITRVSTRSLRQNPTSSRWGKVVGGIVAGKRAVAEGGDRARRRVFVSALDGWMP